MPHIPIKTRAPLHYLLQKYHWLPTNIHIHTHAHAHAHSHAHVHAHVHTYIHTYIYDVCLSGSLFTYQHNSYSKLQYQYHWPWGMWFSTIRSVWFSVFFSVIEGVYHGILKIRNNYQQARYNDWFGLTQICLYACEFYIYIMPSTFYVYVRVV